MDARARQEETLEQLDRLVAVFHDTAVVGNKTPFPETADYNRDVLRSIFSQIRTRFSLKTNEAVQATELERFLDSRSYCELPSRAEFNRRLGTARDALLQEIRTGAAPVSAAGTATLPTRSGTLGRVAAVIGVAVSILALVFAVIGGSPAESTRVLVDGPINVAAEGCSSATRAVALTAPGEVDPTKGGVGLAPPGWEFELTGNNTHGVRDVKVDGKTVRFNLYADGKGTVQGGSLGIPKFCVGAEGANSSVTVYVYVVTERSDLMTWIAANREWVFSGIGVFVLGLILDWLPRATPKTGH